jgi:thiamine transport system ATP-binding protein
MLEVQDIHVTIDGTPAVAGASMTAPTERVTALMGPSGCGKTTLLRVIAGLQHQDAGTISWKGRRLDDLAPNERPIGLMFQDFALFPHRNVARNVGFGLEMAGASEREISSRVADLLELVGLPGFGDRDVIGLSGGEQQRVALARALAPRPELLMLDEPLGSLDSVLRDRLLDEMRAIFDALDLTVLYVTHDTEEAFTVADQLAVMNEGRIVRTGEPADVWNHPGTEFTARFLGFEDVFAAQVGDGTARLGWADVPLAGTGRRVVVRPGGVVISGDGPVTAEVETSVYRGGRHEVTLRLRNGERLHALSPAPLAPGTTVHVAIDPDELAIIE